MIRALASPFVTGQSLYGFRHFEPRFFQEGRREWADVVGKNLLNENKSMQFLLFFHTNPKGRVFRSFVNSDSDLVFFPKNKYSNIRKGQPPKKKYLCKGCPFSSPPKKMGFPSFRFVNGGSLFFVEYTSTNGIQIRFGAQLFQGSQNKNETKNHVLQKKREVSWCFLVFLSLFNEELLISLCFQAQPSELFCNG